MQLTTLDPLPRVINPRDAVTGNRIHVHRGHHRAHSKPAVVGNEDKTSPSVQKSRVEFVEFIARVVSKSRVERALLFLLCSTMSGWLVYLWQSQEYGWWVTVLAAFFLVSAVATLHSSPPSQPSKYQPLQTSEIRHRRTASEFWERGAILTCSPRTHRKLNVTMRLHRSTL